MLARYLIKLHFPQHVRQRPIAAIHLQAILPTFLDLDGVGKVGVRAAKAGAETPVVEVAEVAFKDGVDEPLGVFLGEWAHGRKGTGRVARRLRGSRSRG